MEKEREARKRNYICSISSNIFFSQMWTEFSFVARLAPYSNLGEKT